MVYTIVRGILWPNLYGVHIPGWGLWPDLYNLCTLIRGIIFGIYNVRGSGVEFIKNNKIQ